MYWLIIAVHVVVCLVLISVILLQAGRGGGLSETMGGDTAQSVLGTQAPTVLRKATEVSAVLFLITCLILGIMTARTSKSLMRAGMPIVPIAQQGQGAPMNADDNPPIDY